MTIAIGGIQMDINIVISNTYVLFFVGFLGMLAHFIKKFQTQDLKIADKNVLSAMKTYFFTTDVLNTILAVIAYIVVFISMYQKHYVDVYTVFTGGYLADNLFNKAEQTGLKM